jgi:hypothetical protein
MLMCAFGGWLLARGCAAAFNEPVGALVTDGTTSERQPDAGGPFQLGDKVRVGSTEIQLSEAYVGPVKLNMGPVSVPKGPYLVVYVAVSNTSKDRKLEYRAWTTPFGTTAKLQDDAGNTYKLQQLLGKAVGATMGEALYPNQMGVEVLAFEPPVKAAKTLLLSLPGLGIGEHGVVEFAIDCDKLPNIGSHDTPSRLPQAGKPTERRSR